MSVTKRPQRIARRLFRDCLAGQTLDETQARRAVLRIVESGRRDGLAILAHFERLVRLDAAEQTAVVETAVPMPADVQGRVEAFLKRTSRPGLHISYVLTPALVGGMRIRVGSVVHDCSVRGRLAALEARL